MPNSAWMDDLVNLLKPEDPANVASAFAGMRGSVPIYAALYSKDASGPQELAFEARNNAQSQALRDAQYAALQKKQGLAAIPDEALRRAVAARMSQEEQYPPALATRRADFAPQPRHEMRQYAEGGAVRPDFTQPDMADGGAFIPDQEYQKGGGVKKSLQQMAEELFSKGVKTADAPDLARRSLFGLKAQPALDLPLARMDDIQKDLAKAPAITEKSVTIDPGQGAAKSTLKSLTETPMSRRAVMQTAAGQVLRHTIPGLNEALPTPDILGEIGKIVDVAKPMAAAPAFTNPIAIIMHMRKNGASEEEIAKALGVPNPGGMTPTAKPTHGPRPQEEINASKDFMFRDPEARAILEKVSDGDIIKFAQLGMDKPNALPYDWQMKRWLENGELDERMRAWLATKGEHTFMPKDSAPPVDRDRAVRERIAFQNMYDDVTNPSNYLRGTPPTLKTPSRAFQEITGLGVDTNAPLISMRDELRQIRAADPEQYKAIKNAAKDVSMDSAETARAMGLPERKVGKVLRGEMSTDDLPNWYKFHQDFEYQKGGSVRKTLAEMAQELMSKGVKTADTPDLARRSLFGLKAQPKLDLPLARMDDIKKDVAKDMGKDLAKAPTVSEKSVEVNPATGSVKSTLQSLVETPMSRRSVLSAAAGQVLRHALPGMGDVVPTPDILGEIAKIADVAKPVQAAAALPVTLESILAGAIGQGVKKKEAVDLAKLQFPGYDSDQIKDTYKVLKNPYKNVDLDEDVIDMFEMSRPAENMKMFTGAPSDSPLFAMRPYMRALKQASPKVYDTAKAYSKDTAMDSVEGMLHSGLLRNEDEVARYLRNDPSIYDLIERRQ